MAHSRPAERSPGPGGPGRNSRRTRPAPPAAAALPPTAPLKLPPGPVKPDHACRRHAAHPILSAARAQVICRSRYAEDRLAEAVARGVRQYVLVGAGLDSFGYRSALADQVRVFEVDHRDTQDWKRAALAAARIDVPAGVTFAAALGTDSLTAALQASGFDFGQPAVVSWLGSSCT
ncbi:MAG: class I SAM-dependent methyltransferase [Streptosporangiaceae bacterium]